MAELLTALSNSFTVLFVVSSMFGIGLSLTVAEMLQPLRDGRVVASALLANFVVVPAAAYVLSRLIPMEHDLQIGLLVFGCAAGTPVLPRLAQIANANVPFAVGLMVLLLGATVVYLPLVLPLLVPGIVVDAAHIAVSLALTMLVPLAAGLLVMARWSKTAATLKPHITQLGNLSLALLLVPMLALNLPSVLSLFGSGAIIAVLVLLVVSMAAGYLLGGPAADTRQVVALGAGQRNLAAAFVVATGNFAAQPEVSVVVAAAGLVGMALVMPIAAELGKRSKAAGIPAMTEPSTHA